MTVVLFTADVLASLASGADSVAVAPVALLAELVAVAPVSALVAVAL